MSMVKRLLANIRSRTQSTTSSRVVGLRSRRKFVNGTREVPHFNSKWITTTWKSFATIPMLCSTLSGIRRMMEYSTTGRTTMTVFWRAGRTLWLIFWWNLTLNWIRCRRLLRRAGASAHAWARAFCRTVHWRSVFCGLVWWWCQCWGRCRVTSRVVGSVVNNQSWGRRGGLVVEK